MELPIRTVLVYFLEDYLRVEDEIVPVCGGQAAVLVNVVFQDKNKFEGNYQRVEFQAVVVYGLSHVLKILLDLVDKNFENSVIADFVFQVNGHVGEHLFLKSPIRFPPLRVLYFLQPLQPFEQFFY